MAKAPLTRLIFMAGLAALAVGLYIFTQVGARPDFIIPRRINQTAAMLLVSIAIAYSSVVFQTITNNRILTPAVIGLESVYMFIQTAIVMLFTTGSYLITGIPNFLLSLGLMVAFSLGLFSILFKREGQNILFLLLAGMVMGTMFGSLTSYFQMIIDPSEFFVLQARMFASFNAINLDLLYISMAVLALAIIPTLPFVKYLDVLSLGVEHAVGLGVNHTRLSRGFLISIAVMVSVSTALVGPITFLGVLVANTTYQYIKSHKHIYILPTCIAITALFLVGGQFLVSRVFNFSTTLSIIINFIGGLYFLLLLLKENK